MSTGLAEFGPGDSWELVLANADLALYASKAAGRDRVVRAGGWQSAPPDALAHLGAG